MALKNPEESQETDGSENPEESQETDGSEKSRRISGN